MLRTILALLVTVAMTVPAEACHRHRAARHRHRQRACVPAYPTQQAPAYYAPQVQPAVVPTPQAVVAAPDTYGAALTVINVERARTGRRPLPFSATLAAYAATNSGVHSPGSSGGAMQVWASSGDPVAAARMWLSSGPHYAILMSATTSIGISASPGGTTANAR